MGRPAVLALQMIGLSRDVVCVKWGVLYFWFVSLVGWAYAEAAGELEWQNPLHDFGVVRQGMPVEHRFIFRNPGDQPVTISRIDMSEPGMTSSFSRTTAPGAEGTVTVKFKTDIQEGEVTAHLMVRTDQSKGLATTLELRGTVQPLIEFQPMPAVFTSAFRGEPGERVVTIVNHDDRPLTIQRLELEGTNFAAKIEAVQPGREFRLVVTVPEKADYGRHFEWLRIHTDHPQNPQIRIPVNVLVKHDVYAAPEEISFGEMNASQLRNDPGMLEMLTQTTIVSVRAGELELGEVSTDVQGIRVKVSPNETSDRFRIDVSLDPGSLQPRTLSGHIRVPTSHPEFPVLSIPVSGAIE